MAKSSSPSQAAAALSAAPTVAGLVQSLSAQHNAVVVAASDPQPTPENCSAVAQMTLWMGMAKLYRLMYPKNLLTSPEGVANWMDSFLFRGLMYVVGLKAKDCNRDNHRGVSGTPLRLEGKRVIVRVEAIWEVVRVVLTWLGRDVSWLGRDEEGKEAILFRGENALKLDWRFLERDGVGKKWGCNMKAIVTAYSKSQYWPGENAIAKQKLDEVKAAFETLDELQVEVVTGNAMVRTYKKKQKVTPMMGEHGLVVVESFALIPLHHQGVIGKGCRVKAAKPMLLHAGATKPTRWFYALTAQSGGYMFGLCCKEDDDCDMLVGYVKSYVMGNVDGCGNCTAKSWKRKSWYRHGVTSVPVDTADEEEKEREEEEEEEEDEEDEEDEEEEDEEEEEEEEEDDAELFITSDELDAELQSLGERMKANAIGTEEFARGIQELLLKTHKALVMHEVADELGHTIEKQKRLRSRWVCLVSNVQRGVMSSMQVARWFTIKVLQTHKANWKAAKKVSAAKQHNMGVLNQQLNAESEAYAARVAALESALEAARAATKVEEEKLQQWADNAIARYEEFADKEFEPLKRELEASKVQCSELQAELEQERAARTREVREVQQLQGQQEELRRMLHEKEQCIEAVECAAVVAAEKAEWDQGKWHPQNSAQAEELMRHFMDRMTELRVQEEQERRRAEEEAVIEEARQNECVVCLSRVPTHVLVPCGHKCLCERCAQGEYPGGCPVCREPITTTMKVYDALD